MPKRMKFDNKAAHGKKIDLILPGLDRGNGRNKNRFRVSSETNDRALFESRQAMIRDLASRLLFPVLRARLDRRFTTTELHLAYRGGREGLDNLISHSTRELLSKWVEQYSRVNQTKGAQKSQKQITRFIDSCGGPQRATASDLTAENVSEFLVALKSKRGTQATPASGATKNRYRAAIGAFASHLIRSGVITKHPIAFRAVPKSQEADSRLPDFSAEDYRRYFARIADYDPAFTVFFRLLLHTGADISEVHSRTVAHCDLERMQPRIRYKRTKTKTQARIRAVPFPVQAVAELRAHIAAHNLGRGDMLFGMLEEGELETVQTVHGNARLAAGQVDLRIKDLRHIAAISWRKAGVDLQSIREWLGHATIQQTVIYDRFKPDDSFDAPKVQLAAAAFMEAAGNVLPFRQASA